MLMSLGQYLMWMNWLYQIETEQQVRSVSNGSNQLERFWVVNGTETEPLQRALPHENPDHCNWAGFTTWNPAF